MNISQFLTSTLVSAGIALPLLSGAIPAAHARGISDQWYIGIGGTGAWLQPDPDQPGNNVDEAIGTGGSFVIGRDLDERSSLQLQAMALGEAILDDTNPVAYNAGDVAVVYRFFDSRDNNLTRGGFGASVYGRFALGYMQRESDTALERGSSVYFGVGAGVETYVTDNIALRTEAFFHDIDSVSGTLSLVFRFGGTARGLGRPSSTVSGPRAPSTTPQTSAQSQTPTATVPSTPAVSDSVVPVLPTPAPTSSTVADADKDGVDDTNDLCGESTPGYPVRADGCPLFDGVLSGIKFESASTALAAGSEVQLDFLVDLLVNQFPTARIELHSHTDNEGDVRSQAILTRGRLKTVGTYLVDRGVRANRLVLRSFGGSRPLYDNVSEQGRKANNRIEVIERPR